MTPPRAPVPPRRLVEDPEDGSAGARLLRALGPADAPEGARARVWRRVSGAPGERRRRRWAVVPALAALAAAAVFVVSAIRSPAPVVLALAAGVVEQPSLARVRTGAGSRALVRVGPAAVLLAEETEAEISGSEVAVFRGRVAVATATGSPVVLRAGDRSVSGTGMFAAALVDSERFERAEVSGEERALLERFGRGAGPESRLRVEAPDGYAVGLDGEQIGRSPLRALLPLGARVVLGRRPDGTQLTGEVTVVEGHETVYVLKEGGAAPAGGGEGAGGAVDSALATSPGRAGDATPESTSANGSGHGGDSAPESTSANGSGHGSDSMPESTSANGSGHSGDSAPESTSANGSGHGGDSAPGRAATAQPSPARGSSHPGDSTPAASLAHAGEVAPGRVPAREPGRGGKRATGAKPPHAPAPSPVAPEAISARDPAPTPPSPLAPSPPEPGGELVPPTSVPAPRSSDAATAADPDAAAYAQAKELLARGEPARAAAIFSDVARGHSSRAELSLYELGRTRLRSLHDPVAARSAFSSYLERYPSGLLLQEVELSLIESELAGSDFTAARASMDRFLSSHPRSERRDEVLLLRANLDRDRGDCASALDRYRALSKGAGAIADDATYFAAACAQQLGRPEEARTLLQESLRRFPAGRHADEARRALAGR